MTDLDEAIDKLIAAKQDKLGPLIDAVRVLGMEDLLCDKNFAGKLANTHGGYLVSRGILLVYHRHRTLSSNGTTGLARWDTALASELNGKLETVGAAKEKLSEAKMMAAGALTNMGYKAAEIDEHLESAPECADPDCSPPHYEVVIRYVLKQLGGDHD